ncbi:MAG: mucoidy inhibitor MuiA family protein [Bacteroidota bacterium]
MRLTTFTLLLVSILSYGQDRHSKIIASNIKEVTVFLEDAQIKRKASTSLTKGKSTVVLEKLSPYVDKKSIQVKALGDFTILSVNSKINFLEELSQNQRLDSIQTAIDNLEIKVAEANGRLQVLTEKLSLLNENKKLTGENSSLSLSQLRDAIIFFEKEITGIKKEELQLQGSISDYEKQRNKLEKEKSGGKNNKGKPTSEIIIRVESSSEAKAELLITYLVKNAGWFPKYDVRAESVDRPIQIDYKASVYQNTGNDWNDVKLRFSNGNPSEGGTAPMLSTWFLNYARLTSYRSTQNRSTPGFITGRVSSAEDGSALPGVNVVIKGTTVGTVTDINGNYSLARPSGNITLVFSFIGLTTEEVAVGSRSIVDVGLSPDVQQLSEVLVRGFSSKKNRLSSTGAVHRGSDDEFEYEANINNTQVFENQTTVEIEVTDPYTLKSNGEQIQVDLKKYQIEAIFEYFAVPKLDKDAFLVAKITNWDQYNFLAGEANLYFEDAYVGRSILDAKSLKDTLEISLGRDKSIVINRQKKNELSKKRSMGSNITESRTYSIEIRNQKTSSISLTLLDQIPKSINSNISVESTELSGGRFNKETGEVKWELKLDSQSKQDLTFGYQVKYPKRERVILE